MNDYFGAVAELRRRIMALENKERAPVWISVKDGLPKEDNWILFCHAGNELPEMGVFMDGKFVLPDLGYLQREVTHWMPLPQPPKEWC